MDPEIVEMLRFLDPEIVEKVDKSYISLCMIKIDSEEHIIWPQIIRPQSFLFKLDNQ